jgi:hypothetical protein
VSFSGVLRDENGAPVPNATVFLTGPNGAAQQATAADGSFNLSAPVGSYQLCIGWQRYTCITYPSPSPTGFPNSFSGATTSSFNLTGNLVQDLTVPNRIVTVHVVDSNGNPITGATPTVNATNTSFTVAPGLTMAGTFYDNGPPTDASGTTVVHVLGGSPASLTIQLANGSSFGVTIPALTTDTTIFVQSGGSGSLQPAIASANPVQGGLGAAVSIAGQYWPGPGTASIRFTHGSDTGTASVNAFGNLSGSIAVGSTEPAGSDPILVTLGSTTVTVPFTVNAPPSASAIASPSSGAAGIVLSVAGQHWNPSGGPVSLHFSSGGDIAGATVDVSGNLSANISVGVTEAVGSNPIIVAQGSTVVTVPFTVTSAASAPTLLIAPGQGAPGTVVSLSGQHWPTAGPMSVIFTSGTDVGTASVDGSGSLTGSITVGSSEPLGSDPIDVFDGSTFASAAFTVIPAAGAPTLTATPVLGASGTTVALSGQHWNASGGSAVVSFAFGTDSGTASIDGSGNLTGSITVSAAEPLGANQIVVRQDATTVGAAFTVVPTSSSAPYAFANVSQGGIGTLVTIGGHNWDPHGGAVSIHFTHGPDTGTGTVDGSGNLTGSIRVGAAEAAGSNPLIITQGSTTVLVSVGVLPSGGAGSSPPVGGGGLPPGSGVTVTGPGGGTCTTTVNADGTFSCPLPIHGPPGQYFYTVHDGSITYTIPFTVLPPTATATPSQGGSGTVVSISGTLWDPTGGPVTVKFAAGPDIGTATVDASGNLTGSITVGGSEIVGSNPIILTQEGFSLPIQFIVLAGASGGGGTGGGHGECTVTPTAPRSPSSAPGNGSATVSWGPPLKPSQPCVAGDLVTPYLGGVALTPTLVVGPGTTTVIKGLINGDKYTFTVAAENGSAEGSASAMTAPITIGSPQRVTNLSVLRGHGSVVLRWNAPKITNGKPITGYMIAEYLGSKLVLVRSFGATTSATIGKLTKGKAYTFIVAAENKRGVGQFARSQPVKPT